MTDKPFGKRRYLALWFPFFATDRLRIAAPNLCARRPDAPIVLAEKIRGGMRIAALDRTAQALGLTIGLALADARARIPDLQVFDADPYADMDWLERLADGCIRYTPSVALDPPEGLVLDIAGCAHLFGGETEMVRMIEARLEAAGMQVRAACADAPDAAHALARFQTLPGADEAAAVRRLPVAALRLDAESETALKRAGLKSVGDVASRPMAVIAARFGAEAVTAIRRLLGEAESPLAPRRIAPALMNERRFAEPVARTEYALQMLEELAGETALQLEEIKRGGRRFEALFFRTDGMVLRLRVETSLPTRDPSAIMRLFHERLESLSDPVDPGFGFDLIRMTIPQTEPLAPSQLALEGGAVSETQMAELVDRLSTRIGRGRIVRLHPQDTHIPEQAQLALPAVDGAAPATWPCPEPGGAPLRPLHLFDPPQPITVGDMATADGPPQSFRWRRALHDVTRSEGPERIAAEWWRRKGGYEPGKGGLTRDYYRVEDTRGRRYWIFRHGMTGDPHWFLHGVFA
ncbi:protein ImuB [Sphingobium boeckii]|uniref:Protein ImuB n=1 Tax=Sphingobium boeckii TaxID=1082345 RepID=A0A7W9EF24_9SPHN|nr:protein ImuB [Sphingobium boeckii]